LAVELHCKCGQHFTVPESARGALVECPTCSGTIFVPSGPDVAESMDLGRTDAGSDVVGEALTSDEMLSLHEEEPSDGTSIAETQVAQEGAQPTEAAVPAERVVAGPEDSGLEAGRRGFAIRYDDVVVRERRRYDRCPQCDVELEPETRICTNCGFDLVTGERVKRVAVEEGTQGAAEAAADIGLGVAAFLATRIVKLRYGLIAASLAALLIIVIAGFLARHRARTGYYEQISGGGLVGAWFTAAQEAVEREAFDLERRKQEEIEMAMVKLNREPQAEVGVFSKESKAAAQQAYLRAREAYVIDRDPAEAERVLRAIEVLYGPMEPWGGRAREELARIRGAATRPAAPDTRPAPTSRPDE